MKASTISEKNHPNSPEVSPASPQDWEPITVEVDGKSVTITDADLLEQVAIAAPSVRRNVQRMLARTQVSRNETRERRAEMTPVQRRRNIVRDKISSKALEQGDIHYIHSVLALCGLPYKRPPEGILEYEREYGRMSLSLEAGKLKDPVSGNWVRQGLPYGPKARLLLLHICTRAMQQKSPVIDLENSLSAFIESMGIHKSGGKRGSFNAFKEQINRLAACRMQIGLWQGTRAITINTQPISSFDVWLPKNPDQAMLWNSSVTLSRDFYDSLEKHALPVDVRALSALSHSAKQMDFLLWLSYRVKDLEKPYLLTWNKVHEQFCQSSTNRLIDFQRDFKKDMADIGEIFSVELPVQFGEHGVLLKPCEPDKLFVAPDEKAGRRKKRT